MSTIKDIIPTSEELMEPPPKEDLEPDLPNIASDQEIKEAAASLGMAAFDPAHTRSMVKIGAFISKQGLIHHAVGRAVMTMEKMDGLLDSTMALANEYKDAEFKLEAIGKANEVAKTILAYTKATVELETEGHVPHDKEQKRRRFQTDQPVVPVQQNFTGPTTVNVANTGEPKPS